MSKLWLCGLTSCVILCLSVPARADDAEDKALDFVKKPNGKVTHDENAPGKPVIALDLHLRQVTDERLKRLAGLTNLTTLSIRDQCELLGLNRSTYYYTAATETEDNLELMRVIDRQYLETPFYGSRRMREWLQVMGLEAIYPKHRTSLSSPGHRKYPYLLRGLQVDRPN